MRSARFTIDTGGRTVTDITDRVAAFADAGGDGLVHVFVPHATAGVALMETGSGSEEDLEEAVGRFLPAEDVYVHRHGSAGHGRDHLLPVFIGPSLVLPVSGGQVTLGTWQSIVVVDTNRDNNRRDVVMSFLPG